VVIWHTGVNLQVDQSRRPGPPYDTLPSEERIAFDFAGDRVAYEFRARWPDFVRHVEQVAGPDGGVVRDFNVGDERWRDDLTPRRLDPVGRRVPQTVVREALAAPEGIRLLGTGTIAGTLVDVVSYVQPDGRLASLYIDRETALPVAHELLLDDPRTGDDIDRVLYGDYTHTAELRLPRRLTYVQAGRQVAELIVDSMATDPARVAMAMAPLDSAMAARPRGEAADEPPQATVQEVAPGAYLVAARSAPNYSLLFVDLGPHLLAVEAPLSYEVTRAAINAAVDATGKPVRYATITHHHGDHSAGVLAYAEAGATLVTTPGNTELLRTMVEAPRSLAGLDAPAPVRIETVTGERHFESPLGDVILRDIGPNAHAVEHIVALLPYAGLVFQGDLVQFPHDGSVEPARPQTHSLAALVDSLDWPVQWIAGVHGRMGTTADLRRAIEAARARR
jgi:glyoxylase-like metal-dependent hydrolase (beta-lactamase superfamily II)